MTQDKEHTPALMQQAADEAREWLVRKGGYYYRHGFCGYTTRPSEAGRYTRSEAEAEAAIEPDIMMALHQDEVPGANPVAAEVTIATLIAQLAAAERERDAQYEENVARIAAEGAAILRAESAEAKVAVAAEDERDRLIQSLGAPLGPVVVDGRNERWRSTTIWWLQDQGALLPRDRAAIRALADQHKPSPAADDVVGVSGKKAG